MPAKVGASGGGDMHLHTHLSLTSEADTTGTKKMKNSTDEVTASVGRANRASLEFLGTGLGLLFMTMGLARAVQSTTMVLKEFGIITEQNEKQWRKFNVVFQAASSWLTLMVTMYMLYLAVLDRSANAKNREAAATARQAKSEGVLQVIKGGLGAIGIALIIGIAIAMVLGAVAMATAQFGYSGVINRDTVFLAHAGEEVNIGQPGSSGGGGGGDTVNLYYLGDNLDELLSRARTHNMIVKRARGVV
jgi:hypothetical protein